MKKILKLRGEIIVIAIVSIFIATIGVMAFGNFILTKQNKTEDIKVIGKNKKINNIISQYKEGDIKENQFMDIINKWSDKYINIYLVDSSGKVIASREKGVKYIDLNEVKNGLKTKLEGKNVFEICGVINVDDEKNIVYYSNYYAKDFQNVIGILIVTLILFIILTHKRISYIGEINRGITSIANGNLSKRINIKYKNELSELADSINKMTTILEKEDYKEREFITNISHDLRTPLTTILGYIKMIEESKYKNQKELDKYISIISKKADYLKVLIDNFFTYSKLSSRDIKVKYSNINCNLFLKQIIEEEKMNFAEKGLDLKLSIVKEKVYVNADIELMARAINNLLSNALKYSKENTEVNVIMDTETYNKKTYVTISVINIPNEKVNKDDIKRFFKRLYKSEKGRNSEGNGLGLNITEEIMKLNNGFIRGQALDNKIIFKLGFVKVEK